MTRHTGIHEAALFFARIEIGFWVVVGVAVVSILVLTVGGWR